ncbi:DUF6233 domain-containing protein [Streptomyces sp. NPDC002778]
MGGPHRRQDRNPQAAGGREEHGRQSRTAPPNWVVELGIGSSQPPIEVHAGDCHMAGKRRRAVSLDEARRLLETGLRAGTHCQPDNQLGILNIAAAAA